LFGIEERQGGSQMQKDHLEILLEDMNSKFELMIEGYQSLNSKIDDLSRKTDERFDLVDFKFSVLNQKIDAVDEKLSKKIDAVATDLKSHRADTEAHHGGVYLVKES
jgi:hypothetical protein